MRKFLEKLIKAKEERAKELREMIKKSEDVNEVRALGDTLQSVLDELTEAKSQLAELDEPAASDDEETSGAEGRNFNPVASMAMRNGVNPETDENNDDPRATMEYRKAFMNYVKTGKRSDALKLENRSGNDQTELSDLGTLGVLIPLTVVNEIIKGVEKVYGQLYAKVKKTNLKGGVKYPIGSFSATFNRINEVGEGSAPSDRQNGGSITGSVEFGYKIGEIRLAQTLLMSVMNVEVFEAELAKVIVEAYVEAMDKEIINGNPTNNEMVGILTNHADGIQKITALTGHVVEISPNEMKDWKTWQKKLFAKIPLSMRGQKPEFVMTAGTFEANIETLEDSNGQPVARNIYNPVTGEETATFKGKGVTFVEEDIFPNFDDASTGAYFGMYWVAEKAYAINSNLEFAVRRYFDEEKNQWVDKGIVINDGKILDPKYIFLLKKVANS